MRRLLKWLGIGVAALVAVTVLFLGSGYFLPADIELELEETVDAPPEAVFDLLATHEGVERWWGQAARDMGDDLEVTHLGGPERGVGMELGFGAPGGPVFERWTYTSAEPTASVAMDVDFQIFVSHRVLELTPEGTGTRLRLREAARIDSPIWRWMLRLGRESAIENRHTVLAAAGTAAKR